MQDTNDLILIYVSESKLRIIAVNLSDTYNKVYKTKQALNRIFLTLYCVACLIRHVQPKFWF